MHEKLTEMMTKVKDVNEIKETLLSWLKEEAHCGKEAFHVDSNGKVTDMIKDLAQTEKECAEALYYMVVVEAMLNPDMNSYDSSMGYNHRHLRNGEFAKSGRGHVVNGGTSGFHPGPFVDQEPYIDAYLHNPDEFRRVMQNHPSMGYNDGMNRGDWNKNRSKYGQAYDEYKEARRHYTESRNPVDKDKMDHHIMEHVHNTLESLQEMWEASDDAMLKKRVVDEASTVLNQMKTSMVK